jgi:pilus assembly protein CpaB
MDRRFLTVLGVSLVFALVVSSIFYQMSARGNSSASQRSPAAQELKDVVVSSRPLALGTTIKPGDIKIVKMAVESFPKGAFSKDTEVLDRPVVSNILADEPILDGRLAQRGAGVGLNVVIPVGMRAVTIRVNDVTGVAGYVLPGSHVDVLVTGHPPGGDQTVTRTFLQNMQVLATGQAMQADARGQAIQAPTVTLMATPDQAELLTLANSEGHIQLILRSGTDQTIEKTRGSRSNELFKSWGGGYAPKPSRGTLPDDEQEQPRPVRRRVAPPAPVVVAQQTPPVAVPAPPPPPDQVIVIRGTQKSVETVRSSRQ